MVKKIVRNVMFLKKKSIEATKDDKQIITDLEDTLRANTDNCVGLAANMIGYNKRIIIVSLGFANMVMINPVIVGKKGEYETEEGCLSLDGERKTKRYEEILVEYYNKNFEKKSQKFTGYVAQIIQHECDHLEGIII
ncbi:peptide deformylase [Eubacterium uniforme]|uniref:Peptide deformylase n=1 Tax=Eubacterium uniforme TaxID=39495 RepID=A0A1T4VK87_9FIRM|nr:peptide deformylase [Eubacterium uniforme]SKA65346.1 peptide deformylase [Eubacterium uniforme]HAH17984.1 peptide deformylase [Eubacterium sp.]HAV91060.1 peptide deformylase [Eubacterium sp.]